MKRMLVPALLSVGLSVCAASAERTVYLEEFDNLGDYVACFNEGTAVAEKEAGGPKALRFAPMEPGAARRGFFHVAEPPKARDWSGAFEDFRNSSYCWEAKDWQRLDAGWACPADAQWHWMDAVGTCMGEFIWTGIDYLGGPGWCDFWRAAPNFTDPEAQRKALEEVRAHGLARTIIHACDTGFLDLAGFRKDSFWLYQSRWRPDLPMAHILPHWNWKGREGEVTPVYVFTSGDEAELFLNGRSLGRRRKEPGVWDRAYRLRWDDVRYEPGVLEAVAYREGREWARDTVRTTGPAARLAAVAERGRISSDGEDVCYIDVRIEDAAGLLVPDACDCIAFAVEGPARIVATENGDELDSSDFRQPSRCAFNGLVQALVRPFPGAVGTIRVTASAEGLAPALAEFEAC